MSALADAAVGSIPIVGDLYGVFQSFGHRGSQVINAAKNGDARGMLASIAALGVETAGEAFIPDNPAIGALHAATGKKPEQFLGDMVHKTIVGEGNDLHVEGEKGKGIPKPLTAKQRDSLNKVVKYLQERVKDGKPIDKEMIEEIDKLGLSGEQATKAKEMAVQVAAIEATEQLRKTQLENDGKISKDESEKTKETLNEIAEAAKEAGLKNAEDVVRSGAAPEGAGQPEPEASKGLFG